MKPGIILAQTIFKDYENLSYEVWLHFIENKKIDGPLNLFKTSKNIFRHSFRKYKSNKVTTESIQRYHNCTNVKQ